MTGATQVKGIRLKWHFSVNLGQLSARKIILRASFRFSIVAVWLMHVLRCTYFAHRPMKPRQLSVPQRQGCSWPRETCRNCSSGRFLRQLSRASWRRRTSMAPPRPLTTQLWHSLTVITSPLYHIAPRNALDHSLRRRRAQILRPPLKAPHTDSHLW